MSRMAKRSFGQRLREWLFGSPLKCGNCGAMKPPSADACSQECEERARWHQTW